MTAPDLAALLPSWELALRAERKSPQTVRTYTTGVKQFLAWAAETGFPPVLDRPTVAAFVASLLDAGYAPATARARYRALRLFSAWLTAEGEVPADALLGSKGPKQDVTVVQPLTDEDLRLLLKSCSGHRFIDRRDEALVRLMVETGLRAGEVIALRTDDVDLANGSALVRRGKGGRGRVVPYGPQTSRAIDRYMRLRRSHRLAAEPALWLGDRGKPFKYEGLARSLKLRAAAAGISGFHLHLLRHTAAHRWLAAGGSERGLMAVAGWSNPAQLMRYTEARASIRAADEARHLGLGDIG